MTAAAVEQAHGAGCDRQFHFACRDGTLMRDAEQTRGLFPPISPVSILLSGRWPTGDGDHPVELDCRAYSTRTIEIILDVLREEFWRFLRPPIDIWQHRHEFVSACDFLLVADTTAGRLTADLVAVAAHVVVDVYHDLAWGGRPSDRAATARVTVSIAPHASNIPHARGRICGIDGVLCPSNEWTRTEAIETPVSSLAELVDIARAVASRWSIMSPCDLARTAPGERAPVDPCAVDGDPVDLLSEDARRDKGASRGVVVFRSKGACSDEVTVGLNDVQTMNPADALVRSDLRDPVCALPVWTPSGRRHRGKAILVVGGTVEDRMRTASSMARAMGHPDVVVHTQGSTDGLSCFKGAKISDDPPDEPGRKTIIIVPEIGRSDERQSLALDNVQDQNCSAIITSNSPTGNGIPLYSYHDVCVLVHPRTYRWARTLISLGLDEGDAILQSCERRAADSGSVVCLVRVGRDRTTVYSPDNPAAVGPCDRCASADARSRTAPSE